MARLRRTHELDLTGLLEGVEIPANRFLAAFEGGDDGRDAELRALLKLRNDPIPTPFAASILSAICSALKLRYLPSDLFTARTSSIARDATPEALRIFTPQSSTRSG